MKYTQVLGVIALLTAPSQATNLASLSHHRHKHHHHHGHRKPQGQDFIELDAKHRQLQNLYSSSEGQSFAKQRGILDKVKAKID